ncbi:MAG: LysM peptidoglycan-binding domain-containing protein [Nitrospiraceae bacterium]
MQKVECGVNDQVSRKILLGTLMLCWVPLLSGCIVLEEKYEREKARSLNFQRLLAQEEKRSAELDNEVKRTKKELAEFEVRNKELAAQVQSVREQMGRLQEEAEAIRESVLLERKAMEDMRKGGTASTRPKKSGPSTELLEDSGGVRADLPRDLADIAQPAPGTKTGATIHVVKPGETLFRISRRYGIEVEKLKKMNKLPDDIIEVGQKLIVGTE